MSSSLSPVTGFMVRKYESIQSNKEEDPGKIRIVLEASKEQVKLMPGMDFEQFLGALNMHQSATEPVALQLRFQTKD